MSKNITIAEGAQAKNFNTVHKLRTNLIGGGTQYWVPEDEAGAYAKLSEKSITKNGTYNASDENKDGYSKVIVNVEANPKLVTKDIYQDGIYNASDDNADGYSKVTVSGVGTTSGTLDNIDSLVPGNDYKIETDPSTGKLVIKLLPSSIKINPLPTKKVYSDGENISLTGATIKAYTADGQLWTDRTHSQGIIPYNEIILTPNKAKYDENASIQYQATIEDTGIIQPIVLEQMPYEYIRYDELYFNPFIWTTVNGYGKVTDMKQYGYEYREWKNMQMSDEVYVIVFETYHEGATNVTPYAFSKKPFSGDLEYYNMYGEYTRHIESSMRTINNKEVHWAQVMGSGVMPRTTMYLAPYNKIDLVHFDIFYICLYGTIITKNQSPQNIQVDWIRPDGQNLGTDLHIDVEE